MNDPVIMFCKPDAVKQGDKLILQAAGVLVVEIENPQDVKLTRARAELDGSELLTLACKAVLTSDAATKKFGEALTRAMIAKQPVA